MNYKLKRLLDIKSHWYDLYYGIRNLIKFFWVIWRFRSWDYSYLLKIMHVAVEDMEQGQIRYGISSDKHKIVKQLKITKNLLKRITDDNYLELAKYNQKDSFKKKRFIMEQIEYLENQDAEYLGKMFKKVRNWWD